MLNGETTLNEKKTPSAFLKQLGPIHADQKDESDVRQMTTAVDLFCGAGGFSLGAKFAGIDIVSAIDNDQHACATYLRNFPNARDGTTRLFQEDLLTFEIDRLKGAVQTCDIIIGGPPCQGFSTHRIRDSGVGDARNKLIHKYFDVVCALRPKIFLVENVPGLLWPRHADYLEQFRCSAEAEGYQLRQPIICDAQAYGIPQRRKRVFLLGIDESAGINSLQFPPPPEITVSSCGHAFRPAPADDENDIHMNHGSDLIKAFKRTPKNGGSRRDSGRTLPCHKNHDGHKDVYGRIDPTKPAPTITTACINPSKGRFVHPAEPHGITLRQAARLQGFPDWFIFEGGLTAGGRQVGNAVPPRMAMHLLTPLKEACLKSL